MNPSVSPFRRFVAPLAFFLTAPLVYALAAYSAPAAEPALPGYASFAELSQQIAALAKPGLATVSSLAKSPGGRDIWLITVSPHKPENKPAILLLGNVEAPHVVGGELAVRIARRLIDQADSPEIKPLLDRFTLYIIPRPNPDGSEALVALPRRERQGNARPTDDDRDGETAEDPADDLNGDGWITHMRVEDPSGKYLPHPDDPRVLVEANPAKNERGRYSLYTEGRDNDGDESYNEDPGDGVSFNRNFTFRYPFFKPGAGPHQVSEPETRAIADFVFDHPNIAAVFSFSPEDNLLHPWKPGADSGRIKTTVAAADAPLLEFLAERYRDLLAAKDPPPAKTGQGSFTEWAYFHTGRWSFAAQAWWIPKVGPPPSTESQPTAAPPTTNPPAAEDGEKPTANGNPTDKTGTDKPAAEKPTPIPPEKKKDPDPREAIQLNALRWLGREKIPGFVPWTRIEHPDFPAQIVEVGGFKPFLLSNPPAKELDSLADIHLRFLQELGQRLPRLADLDTKIEALGGGVHRITATVVNLGYLPTMSDMAKTNRAVHPLMIELALPNDVVFLQGAPRHALEPLAGLGGKSETVWLVRFPQGKPALATITVQSPSVGKQTAHVEFK